MACNRTYGYLKGLGDKMKKDISSYISDSELRMRMEQERTIKEGVKRGIVERDTTKLIAAKISNQLNDWSRDWNRIVETEYQGVFNMGRVQSYMREGQKRTGCAIFCLLFHGRIYLTASSLDYRWNEGNTGAICAAGEPCDFEVYGSLRIEQILKLWFQN